MLLSPRRSPTLKNGCINVQMARVQMSATALPGQAETLDWTAEVYSNDAGRKTD